MSKVIKLVAWKADGTVLDIKEVSYHQRRLAWKPREIKKDMKKYPEVVRVTRSVEMR